MLHTHYTASSTHWFLFPQSRMTFDPLWRYGFDMFMFCVNAASITTPFASLPLPSLPSAVLPTCLLVLPSLLAGWRSAARRCPCSPGRSWCSSVRSYGTVRCTSPASASTTSTPPIPCFSSSSSSLSAGEGPPCCATTLHHHDCKHGT